MNKPKPFCLDRVNNFDHPFICVKDKGHKGKHHEGVLAWKKLIKKGKMTKSSGGVVVVCEW